LPPHIKHKDKTVQETIAVYFVKPQDIHKYPVWSKCSVITAHGA